MGRDAEQLGVDVQSMYRELGRESDRLSREMDKLAAKGKDVAALAEQRAKIDAQLDKTRNALLDRSKRAVLSPDVSKEVRAESQKFLKDEIKNMQRRVAQQYMSGGKIPLAKIQEMEALQGVLDTTKIKPEADWRISFDKPGISRYYSAMRDRSGGGFGGALGGVLGMRRRAMGIARLGAELSNGEIGLGTLHGLRDVKEVGEAGWEWAKKAGFTGGGAAARTVASWAARMGISSSALGAAATAAGSVAGGVALTYGVVKAGEYFGNEAAREVVKAYDPAAKRVRAVFGSGTSKDTIMKLRAIANNGQRGFTAGEMPEAWKNLGEKLGDVTKLLDKGALLQSALKDNVRVNMEGSSALLKRLRGPMNAAELRDTLIDLSYDNKKVMPEIEAAFKQVADRFQAQSDEEKYVERYEPERHYKEKYTDLSLHEAEKERIAARGAWAKI